MARQGAYGVGILTVFYIATALGGQSSGYLVRFVSLTFSRLCVCVCGALSYPQLTRAATTDTVRVLSFVFRNLFCTYADKRMDFSPSKIMTSKIK